MRVLKEHCSVLVLGAKGHGSEWACAAALAALAALHHPRGIRTRRAAAAGAARCSHLAPTPLRARRRRSAGPSAAPPQASDAAYLAPRPENAFRLKPLTPRTLRPAPKTLSVSKGDALFRSMGDLPGAAVGQDELGQTIEFEHGSGVRITATTFACDAKQRASRSRLGTPLYPSQWLGQLYSQLLGHSSPRAQALSRFEGGGVRRRW